MNRKVGKKFVRSWTNYHLFASEGSTGYKQVHLQMLLSRNHTPEEVCPLGWKYIGTFGGMDIGEAWQMFYKVTGWRKLVRDQVPAGDPAREPQPAML